MENLYFAYLFVLRAALKAAPLLEEIAYDTGFPEEDARTAQLVRQLVSDHNMLFSCLKTAQGTAGLGTVMSMPL